MAVTRELLRSAAERLRAAGVASPDHDAAELLAHTLGTTRGRLVLVTDVPGEAAAAFEDLVARRCGRVPLQHLTGRAYFRHGEVAVGPGVFVPRPETELLAGWAVEQLTRARDGRPQTPDSADPLVAVDLCTGSGVIAKAIAEEVPGARVHAVELDDAAHAWAARNLAGTGVDLRHGDLATAFDDLLGTVDVVVSNPPYVPLEAWGVGRARSARPRPAPRALLRRGRARRHPRARPPRRRPAPARGSGGRRARRRPGRVRARRVRRRRAVGGGPRPPRPQRPAPVRHRPAGGPGTPGRAGAGPAVTGWAP
ncbi:HemK/PrmC family methyltransferase [Nocardioides sp. TF02-7]|uniref:N5-glutamine methyltransferase family protein n=1 Tax=Nocardioides sp. TF02-7 TaxID=2917724 RepID=UPI0031F5C6D3